MPGTEKFIKSLEKFRISEDVISEIGEGCEGISDKSPKKVRAAYFKRAVDILTEREPGKLQELLEWNACCKGGAREKASKAFARENAGLPLKEKLEKIKAVPFMGEPMMNDDGRITVRAVSYSDGEKFLCACPNFNGVKRDYSVSSDYCFCCAGHFKHHYEIMLGLKLKTVEIVSSPLDSGGERPCVISFEVI
ncbi:MAG: hypothetical protein ACI4J4_05600 [Ruminiclostridium sp.]